MSVWCNFQLGFETGKKGKSLFDSSDDDDESDDEDRFKIRQEFEGSGGKQVRDFITSMINDILGSTNMFVDMAHMSLC